MKKLNRQNWNVDESRRISYRYQRANEGVLNVLASGGQVIHDMTVDASGLILELEEPFPAIIANEIINDIVSMYGEVNVVCTPRYYRDACNNKLENTYHD